MPEKEGVRKEVKKLLLVSPYCEDGQPEQHKTAIPCFQVLWIMQTLNYSGQDMHYKIRPIPRYLPRN